MLRAQWSFRRVLHTAHARLLTFPLALFIGALVTDITYLNTAHIQWTNFSSWFAGALVGGAGVIACALLAMLLNARRSSPRYHLAYTAVVAVMWIVGLVNAFHHSRDAWSSVGMEGLVMSIVTALLALASGVMLFSRSTSWESER